MKNDGLDHANRPIKYGLTERERQQMVERHFETMRQRQAEVDAAQILTAQVAAALRDG